MNLYKITHDFDGISQTFNIVADSISEAIEESNRQARSQVGERFKKKAMNGDYLKQIVKSNVILCDTNICEIDNG